MGFLKHDDNNIILDAVLTDKGREFLARNDGSFAITKFALSDDEVDYTIIKKFGRTVGKEKVEKNTPVLEGITTQNLAIKYRLLSSGRTSLTYLPLLALTMGTTGDGDIIMLNSFSARRKKVQFKQQSNLGSSIVPADLIMNVAEITLDHRFVQITGTRPRSIGSDSKAKYLCTRDSGVENATGATTISKQFAISPTITSTDFELYGLPGNKNRIRTFGRIVDLNGGANLDFEILVDKTDTQS
tara:strand:- start:1437 stop:2165 length:729 start_codon:yes stop_codon:yes gene_type:complete